MKSVNIFCSMETFKMPFTGMKLRYMRLKMNIPEDLCSRTVMIIFLLCSCAYAMTDQGTGKRQKNIMKEPEPVNLIHRLICIIKNILTVCSCFAFFDKK